ncbi:hypothetical protein K3495_g9158 [Podosphaera aphanis]|nr:hypothetical protein K3495_g9158 [Podosphaera aphanis]
MRDSNSYNGNLRVRHRSRSLSYDSGKDERRRHGRRRESPDYRATRSEGYNKHYSKRRRTRSPSPDPPRRCDDERARSSSPDGDSRRGSRSQQARSSREKVKRPFSRTTKGPLPSQDLSFQASRHQSMVSVAADAEPEKQKPNLAPTGLLAAASNSVVKADGTAIALKYHEPSEARKPPAKDDWKLFVFKGSEIVETIELSRRSCWLIGRDPTITDILAEHPSISKQHAVLQFRYIEKKNEYGDRHGRVRPYLIDLDSANGTSLNKEEITGSRYLELRDKDMIQFGHSSREYVLMLAPKK